MNWAQRRKQSEHFSALVTIGIPIIRGHLMCVAVLSERTIGGEDQRPINQQVQENRMLTPKEIECLRACNECATACLQCATACLREEDVKPMARCIALDYECADICRLAATSIASGSTQLDAVCALCASACDACASECDKHAMDHCRHCAEACKRCADACRSVAK